MHRHDVYNDENHRDYRNISAQLSSAVYHEDKQIPVGWQREEGYQLNYQREIKLPEIKQGEYIGHRVGIYSNVNEKKLIFAFRGTANLYNLVTDIHIVLNSHSRKVITVANLFR